MMIDDGWIMSALHYDWDYMVWMQIVCVDMID